MDKLRQELRISVQGLDLGMFVCRLDRPWLETSFPLQGFKVRTDQELQTLQRSCNHVYVDIAAGRAPDVRYIEFDDAELVEDARKRDEIADLRRTDWSVHADFDSELALASTAHAVLQRGVEEIMEDLKSGRELDLRKLRVGVDAMIDSIIRNPSAFNWLREIKRKDNYAYEHALSCSVWAASFGRHLGMEQEELCELALAGLLFDVGKMRLPAALLGKLTKLDADEVRQVRSHVQHGLDILASTPDMPPTIIQMVATHHERYDGSGYPQGLAGTAIPIGGRILGLIDSYDAMTSRRPYATIRSPHQAVTELYLHRDTLFQAELVEQFIQTCGIYPTGSLVELSDGRVGVVTAVHSLKRLRPSVMLLLDDKLRPLPEFRTLDLGLVREDEQGRPLSIRRGLPPGSHGLDAATLFLD
ncbi:MAG: HD-GYP domain-containing protein [Lysobacter sp.]|nr:HD-GYP domain-containing protein [Lysobacter sp.]